MTGNRIRSQAAPGACLVLLLAVGCGPGTLPPTGDAAAAEATLAKVLDAWKGGGKPEDLRSGDPVVYARDEDWAAGRTLKTYKILDETAENGTEWRVFAILTVAGAGAPAKPQKVCYLITPGSPSSVSRCDTLY